MIRCVGRAAPKYTGVKSTMTRTVVGAPDAAAPISDNAGTKFAKEEDAMLARTVNLVVRRAGMVSVPSCTTTATGIIALAPCSVSATLRNDHGAYDAPLSPTTTARSAKEKEPSAATATVAAAEDGGTVRLGGRGKRRATHSAVIRSSTCLVRVGGGRVWVCFLGA